MNALFVHLHGTNVFNAGSGAPSYLNGCKRPSLPLPVARSSSPSRVEWPSVTVALLVLVRWRQAAAGGPQGRRSGESVSYGRSGGAQEGGSGWVRFGCCNACMISAHWLSITK